MLKKYYCLAIILLSLFSCGSNAQEKIPQGNLNDEDVFFQYAIYFLDEKPSNIDNYKKNLENKFPYLKVQDSLFSFTEIDNSTLVLKEIYNVKDSFAAPDLEYLEYAGRRWRSRK